MSKKKLKKINISKESVWNLINNGVTIIKTESNTDFLLSLQK